MGQKDIIDVLEMEYRKYPDRFLTRKEILKKLGKKIGKGGSGFLNKSLRGLRKHNEVEYKRDESNPYRIKPFLYRFKSFSSRIIKRH